MFRILFFIFFLSTLSACHYRYEKDSMYLYLPNAKYARSNAKSGIQDLHLGYTNIAQQKIELAFQQNPNDPLVVDAMAYFYEKTGRLEIANQYYMQALTVSSQSYEANAMYGGFLCRNGYNALSIPYFRKAAHNPNRVLAQQAYEDGIFCGKEMHRALGDKHLWAYYIQ